jgi:Flp pilus assembly pilin Flp
MRGFKRTISRFVRDEGGAFALIFGVMAVVLIALGGAVVDYVSLEQSRNRAQLALDAAALALQPEITRPGYDEESIRLRAEALVIERIGNADVRAEIDQIVIDPTNGSLFLNGIFVTQTYFVRLVGVPELAARFSSETVRGILDIEVAVALDITGSMEGQRIIDLRAAATRLVDAVVQDDQTLNRTRMALVPYAQAVNVSPYQVQVRGPEQGPVPATRMSWAIGPKKINAGADRDSNGRGVVVKITRHGYAEGDWVYVWNFNNFTSINNKAFRISEVNNNSFRLVGANETGWYNSATGGQVIKCERANCEVLVTSVRHGYTNGQYVVVTDVGGMSGLNYPVPRITPKEFEVRSVTRDTLILGGSMAGGHEPDRLPYIADTGNLHCTWITASVGCTYYRFTTASGGSNTFPLTNCATDRPNNPTSDLPFSASLAGRNYANQSANKCPTSPIVPLTTDKTALKTAIAGLMTDGSTAGNLGIAWAWHMLSPNLGYLWPGSRPDAYDGENIMKAAIIMTDGEFNTVHCNGVVSWNSTDGSGGNADKIACNAPNGAPYAQARAYCDAMKASDKIIIYTVGFGIAEGSAAAELLAYCASGADSYFLAENASGLDAAFQQIASNISALRIAR